MITAWSKHIEDPNGKADFESEVRGSVRVLDRLSAIVTEMETSLNRSEIDPKSFDTPSWAYLQAFKNGQRLAYKQIKSLINLDQQK